MNHQSFDIGALTVHQIVPFPPSQGGNGAVDFSPKFLGGHSIRPTTVVHAVSVNPLPAIELINTQIVNTGAGGAITLTMPTAAAALAAFAAAGITLGVSDTFSLRICTLVNQSVICAPSGTITTMSGGANFTVTGQKSAVVTFRVTSTTVGAETIQFSGLLSN
jgi:hypothetical protein